MWIILIAHWLRSIRQAATLRLSCTIPAMVRVFAYWNIRGVHKLLTTDTDLLSVNKYICLQNFL